MKFNNYREFGGFIERLFMKGSISAEEYSAIMEYVLSLVDALDRMEDDLK